MSDDINVFIIPQEYGALYVSGDIHGEFRKLLYELKRKQIQNATIIIAGDCGIGFEKFEYYRQLYNRLSKTLVQINVLLLMLRGNHDDPEYFDKGLISFPLMKTIPDYTVIHFQKRRILCVGGGISVDRSLRKQRMSNKDVKLYWEGEAPYFDISKLERISSEFRIDTVITHTAPSFCFPIQKQGIKTWLDIDPNLENDLKDERRIMDKISDFLITNDHPVIEWYYGHFHDSIVSFIMNQKFSLLNIHELRLISLFY